MYMQIIVIIDQSPYRYTGLCLCVLSLVEVSFEDPAREYLSRTVLYISSTVSRTFYRNGGPASVLIPIVKIDERNDWILEEHAFLGQT